MARVAGITIQINADGSTAIGAIKDLEKALVGAHSKIELWNHATDLVQKGWAVVTGVVGGAVSALSSLAKEAAAAERAERNLTTALSLRGANAGEIVPKLQAFNQAVQQGTGISGDALTAFQAQAAALGVLPQDLDNVTQAAIGWAQATGQDVAAAGDVAIKVYNGNEKALRQMGLATGDTSKNLDQMASMFGIATEHGLSLEGQLTILSENFGDLQETLGGAVTQSDNATQAIGAINQTVLGLQQVFASQEGRAAVDSFFGLIAGMAADTIDAILGLIRIFDNELIPNIKRGWADLQIMMGKPFVAESLNDDAEAGKNAILTQFEDLADKLRSISEGRGGGIADAILPPVGELERSAKVKGGAAGKFFVEGLVVAAKEKALAGSMDLGLFQGMVGQFGVAAEQMNILSAAATEAQRQHASQLVGVQIGHMHTMFDGYRQRLEENTQATADAVREAEAEAQRSMQRMQGFAMGFYGSLKSEMKAFASGQKSFGEAILSVGQAMIEMLIDEGVRFLITKAFEKAVTKQVAIGSITAASAVAAANTYASTAAIPIIGPIAAPAAAAAAQSTVLGFIGPALAMAQGGFVTGGTAGQDSVPAMLMPGEFVIPTSVVNAIRTGGQIDGGGGGGTVFVAPTIQTLAPPANRASVIRYYKNTVMPVVKQMNRDRLG